MRNAILRNHFNRNYSKLTKGTVLTAEKVVIYILERKYELMENKTLRQWLESRKLHLLILISFHKCS